MSAGSAARSPSTGPTTRCRRPWWPYSGTSDRCTSPPRSRGGFDASRCAKQYEPRTADGSCPSTLTNCSHAAALSVPDGATAVEVREVLASLSPEQRAVLTMRHLEGLNEEEMVDVLDVAAGTVKSRLHRARAAFRERWIA